MKHLNKIVAYFLISVSFFYQSCNNNDDVVQPLGDYAIGVIISNEGGFRNSNSSISFYNPQTKTVENDIFEKVNGRPLGDVLQSVFFHQNRGYLVVNNSNKIEVVEDGTFKSLGTIEDGLANPRYFAAFEDKGFVTNWGTFDENFQLDQSYIAVIDLNTLSVTKKIETPNGTERILVAGNKIYATNSFTNTLTVVNLSTETVEATLELYNSPNGIAVDSRGYIWVICKGTYQGNDGKLFSIEPITNTIDAEIELSRNPAGHLVTNSGKNRIYYTAGTSLYELFYNTKVAPDSPLLTIEAMEGSIYGLGTDPSTDHIYLSDPAGFSGNGRVLRYDNDGNFLDDFEVGIAPNGFWFK